MYGFLLQKFSDSVLLEKLKSITEEIVEDNWWGDTYWGKCKGVGENKLGRMLTKIKKKE